MAVLTQAQQDTRDIEVGGGGIMLMTSFQRCFYMEANGSELDNYEFVHIDNFHV